MANSIAIGNITDKTISFPVLLKINPNSRATCSGVRRTEGAGPILFLDELIISVHNIKFRRDAIPDVIFYIGEENSESQFCFSVPAGIRYKIFGGVPGTEMVQRTQEAQDFIFDHNTKMKITKGLHFCVKFSNFIEKESFSVDTTVTMI